MKFFENIPIYIQIKDNMLLKIFTGKTAPGEKLLSIREAAQFYEVNPNTVAKAYEELEDMGLIHTERTSGKYVIDDNEEIHREKKKFLSMKCLQFLTEIDLYV